MEVEMNIAEGSAEEVQNHITNALRDQIAAGKSSLEIIEGALLGLQNVVVGLDRLGHPHTALGIVGPRTFNTAEELQRALDLSVQAGSPQEAGKAVAALITGMIHEMVTRAPDPLVSFGSLKWFCDTLRSNIDETEKHFIEHIHEAGQAAQAAHEKEGGGSCSA